MKIKNKELSLPLIQGGMGIGISLGNLAGHVGKSGAMGVISTANAGYQNPNFPARPMEANLESLKLEITKAKSIAMGNGLIAINAMVATTGYGASVKAAVEAGVDCVIAGAGLPMDLPELVKGSDVAICPIVSGGRAATTICKVWDKRYGRIPDFVVLEGPEAGGHLGFNRDDLLNQAAPSLEVLLPEVLAAVKPFGEKYGCTIPVFVAGGIYTAADVMHYINQGAAGVQVATRFIATPECDASPEYKQMYIEATKEDIAIVVSPTGMPGRALSNSLVERLKNEKIPITNCMKCLHPCDIATSPYCISRALIKGAQGDRDSGLFFCGSNAWRINKIIPTAELIDELMSEWRKTQ